MNASSQGMLPRNREQVVNLRCGNESCGVSICSNKDVRDPLFMVMEQSKICKSGDKFVRVVTVSPGPMCVLATEQQLADLLRFATSCNRFCVLAVHRSNLFLGPVLVHHRKLFETYHFFCINPGWHLP